MYCPWCHHAKIRDGHCTFCGAQFEVLTTAGGEHLICTGPPKAKVLLVEGHVSRSQLPPDGEAAARKIAVERLKEKIASAIMEEIEIKESDDYLTDGVLLRGEARIVPLGVEL